MTPLKTLALVFAGTLAFLACTKAPVAPEVSLTSPDIQFTDGSATLMLNLTTTAATDVIVSLSATSETLEKERIQLPGNVTILAGNMVATAQISVNDLGLGAGTHLVTISIANAGGANISALARSVTLILEVADRTASISLQGPVRFNNGVAELELVPSTAPQKDITVSLGVVDMKESWKTVLPSAALKLPETVVLPMGQKTPTKVLVELKESALPPQDYQVVIQIADVSSGATVGADSQLTLQAKGAINYSSRTEWRIRHSRSDLVNRIECEVFDVTFSAGESAGYYIFDVEKEYVNTYPSVLDYFSYLVQAIMVEMEEDPFSFKTSSMEYAMYPYRSFEPFQITMIGCDQNGFPTGDYRMLSMSLGISETSIEEYYDRWLGQWKTSDQEIWTISADNRDYGYYKVTGINNADYAVAMDLKYDGSLQLRSQWISSGIYLYGHFDDYYYNSYRPIAEAQWTSDEWLEFKGLPADETNDFEFFMVHDSSASAWPAHYFPFGIKKL